MTQQVKRSRQHVSSAMAGAAIILVSLLVAGGTFYVEQAFAASATPSLTVQTASSSITSFGSQQIQAQIQSGTPSSSYSVTTKVAVPTGAGGPFCDTVSVTTDGNGNAQTTVSFPGTFTAAACSPAGTAGPSTELAGTYSVTVSSVPAITTGTLSTSFAVASAQGAVTGSGSFSASTAVTYNPIPATYTCTAADVTNGVSGCVAAGTQVPGYLACTTSSVSVAQVTTLLGTPSSTTSLPLTYPTTATKYGSASFTGVISTSTPGQKLESDDYNPCLATGTGAVPPSGTISGITAISTQTYTLNAVTINLPSGGTASGGLVITVTSEVLLTATCSSTATAPALPCTTSGLTTLTTSTNNWYQMSVTGTGGLQGVSGTGTAIVIAVTASGGTASSGMYSVTLANVPAGSSGGASTSGNYCGYYTQNGAQVQFTGLSQSAADALITQYPPGAASPC